MKFCSEKETDSKVKAKFSAKKKKVPSGTVFNGEIRETAQISNNRGLVRTVVVHEKEHMRKEFSNIICLGYNTKLMNSGWY